MDRDTAYAKGYAASGRTTTFDLDAAEDRFTARYGHEYAEWFAAGWGDYAGDRPKGYALAEAIHAGIIAGTLTVRDWDTDRAPDDTE